MAIASVLPLQNYTFSGVQPNLRTLSPPASPPSLHLILSYQLHMSTHGHKVMPVLLRFGWAKTIETPPASRAFLPKTIETPPVSRAFLPKTIETPPVSRAFLPKTAETPPVSRAFLPKTIETPPASRVFSSKMVEIHPYLVCFHQKRLRYTRISHVFIKNKRLSSPEEGVYVRLGFVSDSERRRMVSSRIL